MFKKIGPLFGAAVLLVSCSSGSRFIASTSAPVTGRGLGAFLCLKTGFSKAGYPDVSDRSLALIAVSAKLQTAKHMPAAAPAASRLRTEMTTALQSLLALGACTKQAYDFKNDKDAAASNAWLLKPVLASVNTVDFETVFGIDPQFVFPYDTDMHPWTELTSARKLSFWDSRARGTDAHDFAQQFPEGDKAKICMAVVQSCGLDLTACDEPTGPKTNSSSGYGPDNSPLQGNGPPGSQAH